MKYKFLKIYIFQIIFLILNISSVLNTRMPNKNLN